MSLIEVLITIVILGLAGVALLGGLTTGITGSDLHRQQASAQAVLASAGEAVVDNKQIGYMKCASTYPLAGHVTFPKASPTDSSWSVSNVFVTQVLYWNGTDFQPNPCYDPVLTLQKITIEVVSPNGRVHMSRDFVKASS
jgi:type II secretory pathway pseudopilin PulG